MIKNVIFHQEAVHTQYFSYFYLFSKFIQHSEEKGLIQHVIIQSQSGDIHKRSDPRPIKIGLIQTVIMARILIKNKT